MKFKYISAFIAVAICLGSCRPRYNCQCIMGTQTNVTSRATYNFGTISNAEAVSKCNSAKAQTGWDSCGVQKINL